MKIRRYRTGEEEELWQLCRDTTHIVNGRDYTPEQVEKWAPRTVDMHRWRERVRSKNPFVAERDGAILGFAELENDGHISGFYCHHRWQRQGVGRALYGAIENEASRLHFRALHVESSASAAPFFLSMGFEAVDVHEFQDCGAPVKNFIMTKRLDEPQSG